MQLNHVHAKTSWLLYHIRVRDKKIIFKTLTRSVFEGDPLAVSRVRLLGGVAEMLLAPEI